MFTTWYFANNYFAPRYFPKFGVSDVFYFGVDPQIEVEFSVSWSVDSLDGLVDFGVAQDTTIIME